MECPREESNYCLRRAKRTSSPIPQRRPYTRLRLSDMGRGKTQMRHEIHGVRRRETAANPSCLEQDRKPKSLCKAGFAATVFPSTTPAWPQERIAGRAAQTQRRFPEAARI